MENKTIKFLVFLLSSMLSWNCCAGLKMEGVIYKSLFDVKPTSVYQDTFGYIWFGSNNGLFRFDGHEMRAVSHPELDNFRISAIVEGNSGEIWVAGTRGVFRVDAFLLDVKKIPLNCANQLSCHVQALAYDNKTLWVGTKKGLLSLREENAFADKSGDLDYVTDLVSGLDYAAIFAVLIDENNALLLGTNSGLLRFNLLKKSVERIPIQSKIIDERGGSDSATNRDSGIFSLTKTRNGHIYAGGASSLYELNFENNTLRDWKNKQLRSRVWSLSTDGGNIIWVGSVSNGLFRLNLRTNLLEKIAVMDRAGSEVSSLQMISHSTVDQSGNYWATTDTGVFFQLPRKKQNITYLDHHGMDGLVRVHAILKQDDILYYSNMGAGLAAINYPRGEIIALDEVNSQLGSMHITSIQEDASRNIWVATSRGLAVYSPTKKTLIFNQTTRSDSVAVLKTYLDSTGRIWQGARAQLGYFEEGDPTRYKVLANDTNKFFVNFIEHQGALFIGASDGLYVYKSSEDVIEKITFSGLEGSQEIWITDFQRAGNRLLISTRRGLLIVDENALAERSQAIAVKEILFDGYEIISSYVSDGHICAFTKLGLLCSDPANNRVHHLNHFDYNIGGYFKTFEPSGPKIIVSNEKGISLVEPESFARVMHTRGLRLSSLQVDDSNVDLRNRAHGSGENEESGFSIPFAHRSISLSLSNFSFDLRSMNTLEYRIGEEDTWVDIGAERKIVLPRLPPGRHTIFVRSQGDQGDKGGALTVFLNIATPWWYSNLAKVIYIVITLLFFAYLLNVYSKVRNKAILRKNEVLERGIQARTRELEESSILVKRQAAHLQQLIRAKDELFINLTHELKTPLSLMLCPLDLVKNRTTDAQSLELIALAELNGSRLLRDINQLLDIDSSALSIKQEVESHELSGLVAFYIASFSELLAKKDITLEKRFEAGVYVLCSPELLEKIVINLMSNLIKYAPDGAAARVVVGSDESFGFLKITNAGSYIPQEERPLIFERFTRLGQHRAIFGTGIGLALVKQLAEAMKGSVTVESSLESGTSFSVYLPLCSEENLELASMPSKVLADNEANTLRCLMPQADEKIAHSEGKPGILIIEDNKELAQCLAIGLQAKFNVIVAHDGAKGLACAMEELPDLVLTDIGLPKKDGLEICKELKSASQTMHIPVVVLTANASIACRTAAWELLADEFIEKPFDWALLEQRIDSLLKTRDKIRRKLVLEYVINDHVEATENQLPSPVKNKVDKIKRVISQNYSSPEFGPEELASAIGMSKRNLTRQAKELIGITPMEYIKAYRLQQSKYLLSKGYPVTRVSEEVGIKSHSQFSRAFKERYGISPSAFQRQENVALSD